MGTGMTRVLGLSLFLGLWMGVPQAAGAAYDGPLVDSHAHLDEEENAPRFVERMEAHDVTRTLLFVHVDPGEEDRRESVRDLREALGPHPDRFILFVDPADTDAEFTEENLAEAVEAGEGNFRGLGEFALYQPDWRGANLEEAPWSTLFRFAATNDLWVMIHPGDPRHYDQLSRVLAGNPDLRVLVHGFENPARVTDLLRDHENFHHTLDTSTLLLSSGGPGPGQPILYDPGNREDFLRRFDANRETMLANALERWVPVIEAAPARVMWGTDASFQWHLDADVYDRLISFSRDFVALLPEDVQEGYAHANAERVLGEPARLRPISLGEKLTPLPGPAPLLAALSFLALAGRRWA